MGRKEGAGRNGRVGREVTKNPGEEMGHQSSSNGPDHSTRLKGHHSDQG